MGIEKIDEIRIEKVKKLIPKLLYENLVELGINNLKEILEINLREFSEKLGIELKSVRQLKRLQYQINNTPNIFLGEYEYSISSKLEIEKDSALGKIELNRIPELVPLMLLKKLQKNNINTIYDLSNSSLNEFSSFKSTGKKAIKLFKDLIIKLNEEPDIFILNYHANTKPKELPISMPGKEISELNFIECFEKLVNDYLSQLIGDREERKREMFIKRYGLFGSQKYNTVDISLFYEITHERVRQILNDVLHDLEKLLLGEQINDPFQICCNKLVINKIQHFINFLNTYKVISFFNIKQYLKDKHSINIENKDINYLNILFQLYNIEESGRTRLPFSESTYLFIDRKIKKIEFYKTCKLVYDFLKDSVLPINEFDLIISIKKQESNITKEYILIAADQLAEIESLTFKNQKAYQIRFDKLTSLGDQAERVLSEKGKTLHADEILTEINHRLFNLESGKIIKRESLVPSILRNQNIIPKGKTGYYSLWQWNENSETIYDVIYKAFLHYQKPLTHKEIIEYVNTLRPNLKENSIRTITNSRFIQIDKEKYIIPSWEIKYKDRIVEKEKRNKVEKTKKVQIYEILKNQTEKKIPIKEFRILINEKLGVSYFSLYQKLNDSKYFTKTIEEGIKYVSANDHPYEERNEKKDVKQKFYEKVEQLINLSNGVLPQSLLIKKLSKETKFSKGSMYKFLSQAEFIKKTQDKNGAVIISIKSEKKFDKYDFNWDYIKPKLEREIEDVFGDPRQPQYTIQLPEALDMFYKVIVKETSEPGLNGLDERLLPSLFKYFTSSDRNDRLNFLNQITNCLDPFLKKVLLLSSASKYNNFKKLPKAKQGLGSIIEILDKLDKRKNRYQSEEKKASLMPFGRQMFAAYNNRNIEAHEANKWAEKQIVHIISSCIVIYVFAILEYFHDLERNFR